MRFCNFYKQTKVGKKNYIQSLVHGHLNEQLYKQSALYCTSNYFFFEKLQNPGFLRFWGA